MIRRSALRQFSSLSRARYPFQPRPPPVYHNGTSVKQYRVRFQKPPFFSWARTRKWIVYGALMHVFFTQVLSQFITISFEEVEEEVVAEDGSADVQTEEGDEEEVEDGLFIPCGWPKKQPRSFYRASDPEWKEFIKFSKNPAKHRDIQKRLVSAIRSEISNLPNTKRVLGDVNMTKGRWWLEIIFPDGPPQEYEVKGIEITEEFVAWSLKTVTQQEYDRLCRTIFPTATIKASWASMRYQFNMQANKVREYFGLPPHIDLEAAHIKSHLMQKPNTKGIGPGNIPPGIPPNPLSKGFPPPTAHPAPQQESGASESESSGSMLPRLPSIVPRGESQPVTLALFMHNLRKNRKSTPIEPPRGSIVVSGLIEVLGTRGRTTLDVVAAFDPSSDEYLLWSWKPRKIQPKQQRPRGGL